MNEPKSPAQPSQGHETEVWSTDPAFSPQRDLTQTTLGDFRVERKLGHGGMGEVYLATQISLNRPVALKVLRPNLLANPTYLARFEAEAWAAAKLNHPNIVHIYSLGCIDNLRFIAMEYVQGTNLREYIEKKGAPELLLALSIMKQAGQAVGAAGEVGLVHRDIKPENLLLTRKGQVKVADFGLCRDREGDVHLTQQGVTMGTPMYMSPEQVQGHALDHRSDLYSLGVTFYHMLAGQPPFKAETPLALALRHVRDVPVSLAVHRPDLPPELIALVMKLMAKMPEERYASAAEMLRELAKVREALHASTASVAVSLPEMSAPPALAGGDGASLAKTEKAPAVGRGRGKEKSKDKEDGQAVASSVAVPDRLSALRLGGKTIAGVIALAVVVGAVGGWASRAQDLLAEGSPAPNQPAGLWMAPWQQVPAQATAAAQYRYALLATSNGDQEAAWLAVPGRFARDVHFSNLAYVQLARYLFRHHDAEKLEIMAAELGRPNRHHEDRKLAHVVRAAAAALRDDVDGVLDALDGEAPEAVQKGAGQIDTGSAQLGLEVVLYARSTPSGPAHNGELTKRIRSYLQALRMESLDPSWFASNP